VAGPGSAQEDEDYCWCSALHTGEHPLPPLFPSHLICLVVVWIQVAAACCLISYHFLLGI
jgi:hypothetical protein